MGTALSRRVVRKRAAITEIVSEQVRWFLKGVECQLSVVSGQWSVSGCQEVVVILRGHGKPTESGGSRVSRTDH